MGNKTYEITVESGIVVNFVRILGKHGVRFDMGDEWNVGDNIDPSSKVWYRTFRVHTTKKQMKIICSEMNRFK